MKDQMTWFIFFAPNMIENYIKEGKGKESEKEWEQRKEGKRELSNVCSLSFIMATLEISFDLSGLFGGCILKNPPVSVGQCGSTGINYIYHFILILIPDFVS